MIVSAEVELLQQVWRVYPWIVDLALYFFLFGAASRVAFAKIYPGHEGKILAVATGLVLATSLTIAQRRLGFSLESLGPAAAALLSLVAFIVVYRLLKHSGLPTWITITFSILFGFGLLKAALPGLASRFVRDNPGAVLLGLTALALWTWHSAAAGTEHFNRQRPGYALERFKLAPKEDTLRKEQRFIAGRLKDATRTELQEEQKSESGLQKAQRTIESDGLTPKTRPRIESLLKQAQASTAGLERKCAELRQLDDALENFDLKWFNRMRNVNVGQLTQAQKDILKRSILENRRRLQVEEELRKLEIEVAHHVRETELQVSRALDCVQSGNAAGAVGWIGEALRSENQARSLDGQVLSWEKKLLGLVRRQRRDLLKT